MNKPKIPRLSCLLSYDKRKVIIFRKGPSKWTQLILWDLDKDEFKEGQWLHGSVYEQKSDISPNGKYISISIAKYSIREKEDKEFHSWTCISKPPFFSSLFTFFEKNGQARGGYFEDNNHFVFDGSKDQVVTKGINPTGKMRFSYKSQSNKMSIFGEHPLNEKRLTKIGWITKQHWEGNHHKTISPQVKVKKLNSGYSLIMEREIKDFKISVKYFMKKNEVINQIEDAQWMDFDLKNRILLAKNGRLFASNNSSLMNENIEFIELINFSNSTPEEIKPSDEYFKW